MATSAPCGSGRATIMAGRMIRDIRRKTKGDEDVPVIFAVPLSRAGRQKQRQRGWKLCSRHAPEVECIGKGKARTP